MEPLTYKTKKYQYVSYNDSQWIVIFHHNIDKAEAFSNEQEAIYSLNPNKYSILVEINDNNKYNFTHYEFLLYYKIEGFYWQWRQIQNPINEIEQLSVNETSGFDLIKTNYPNQTSFGGLAKTNLNDPNDPEIMTLLNGMLGVKEWYFSIGMYSNADYYVNQKTIPAYSSHETKEVTFFMRIHNILVISHTCIYRTTFSLSILKMLYIFVILK